MGLVSFGHSLDLFVANATFANAVNDFALSNLPFRSNIKKMVALKIDLSNLVQYISMLTRQRVLPASPNLNSSIVQISINETLHIFIYRLVQRYYKPTYVTLAPSNEY